MFAGHVGAAMAIGRAERRVNVGLFVFAAVFLDFMLWLLVPLGLEAVEIPDNFTTTHQASFIFPYSHGLIAAVGWSVLAGATTYACFSRLGHARLRAGGLVAAAVFSHWLLDALVHAPELPLTTANSFKVGVWLWRTMPLALAVEGCIALAGLYLFTSGANLSSAKRMWLTVLVVLITGFTIVGMTVAPPPPSIIAMAASSLGIILVVSVLTGWLGKRREPVA
jgi:hypothetical protein